MVVPAVSGIHWGSWKVSSENKGDYCICQIWQPYLGLLSKKSTCIHICASRSASNGAQIMIVNNYLGRINIEGMNILQQQHPATNQIAMIKGCYSNASYKVIRKRPQTNLSTFSLICRSRYLIRKAPVIQSPLLNSMPSIISTAVL